MKKYNLTQVVAVDSQTREIYFLTGDEMPPGQFVTSNAVLVILDETCETIQGIRKIPVIKKIGTTAPVLHIITSTDEENNNLINTIKGQV